MTLLGILAVCVFAVFMAVWVIVCTASMAIYMDDIKQSFNRGRITDNQSYWYACACGMFHLTVCCAVMWLFGETLLRILEILK